MQKIQSKLTVFFEAPFWVGVYERIIGDRLEACKIIFGSEPKDYEVYRFYLQHRDGFQLSPPVKTDARQEIKINPKRMQRSIRRQLSSQDGIGTKSQLSLKRQQEEHKLLRKEKKRCRKAEEKQRQFELHHQKRKEKHRGK